MAYEFKKLAEVEAVTEVPKGASVLAEVNGAIKRVPGDGLGGGVVKTAIIKSSDYDDALTGIFTASMADVTYSCINMTFEEAVGIISAGEPLGVVLMCVTEGAMTLQGYLGFTSIGGVEAIVILFIQSNSLTLYWTAEGLSTTAPGGR